MNLRISKIENWKLNIELKGDNCENSIKQPWKIEWNPNER